MVEKIQPSATSATLPPTRTGVLLLVDDAAGLAPAPSAAPSAFLSSFFASSFFPSAMGVLSHRLSQLGSGTCGWTRRASTPRELLRIELNGTAQARASTRVGTK